MNISTSLFFCITIIQVLFFTSTITIQASQYEILEIQINNEKTGEIELFTIDLNNIQESKIISEIANYNWITENNLMKNEERNISYNFVPQENRNNFFSFHKNLFKKIFYT